MVPSTKNRYHGNSRLKGDSRLISGYIKLEKSLEYPGRDGRLAIGCVSLDRGEIKARDRNFKISAYRKCLKPLGRMRSLREVQFWGRWAESPKSPRQECVR